MDWGLGHFEHFAAQLGPAAEIVVDELSPRPGDVVLDVGCGTGNATLIVAGQGAQVTGVDPSARLLDVARARATAAGLDVTLASGDAANLPVPDQSVDAIVSVFGVIFAPDPGAAAAELARVLRPGGRIVLSAWLREGALTAQAQLRREIVTAATGVEPPTAPFAWHDPEVLTELFSPYRLVVTTRESSIAFTAESPAAYADGELANHPLWVEAGGLVTPAVWTRARADLIALFEAANEDPAAFRITSRYVIATAAG